MTNEDATTVGASDRPRRTTLTPVTFKIFLNGALKRRGKSGFLRSLKPNAKVLDAGCGNASPMKAKSQRPDLSYFGIDVGDYNQSTPKKFAEKYLVVTPEKFASAIEQFEGQMDAVISSHNIEHCNDPERAIAAMVKALKPSGRLYLAFPCEMSVRFPRRRGTLNFYDDRTHSWLPRWDAALSALRRDGMEVEFSARRCRPLCLAAIGLLWEPVSALFKKSTSATWALYGFESVIWASRPTNIQS